MTSRLGRWIENTFGVEIYKWYARDGWVRTDTALVHRVIEENGASVDVRVFWAHEYQHKDMGSVKRQVGTRFTDRSMFAPRDKIENNVRGISGRKSYPEEKYLYFETEDDNEVVLGEEAHDDE